MKNEKECDSCACGRQPICVGGNQCSLYEEELEEKGEF
jgi:hypothetical protein